MAKTKTEFVILESGLRIATASTRKKADEIVRRFAKNLPVGIGFKFEVQEHQITTSN